MRNRRIVVAVAWVLAWAWDPHATARAAVKEEVAVIHTSLGDIAFRFFDQDAPQHVAYVKELILRGFYDGTAFHRVIPHFVIQGGDPNSKDADRGNDGEGEAEKRLKAEFSDRLHYRPGTVGMARDVDPDSGSCQFFIALENLPRLDGKYTIFGEVISGMEVAQAIAARPRDLKDNPLERVEMKVSIKTKRVAPEVMSVKQGPSGEVLTGPEKPKPWDPGDLRWTAPARSGSPEAGAAAAPGNAAGLDLCVDETGKVLDVRFAHAPAEKAEELQRIVKETWRFVPARLDGSPVKCRFSTDRLGREITPSKVPGTPVDVLSEDLTLPRVLVPVTIPADVIPPAKEPLIRLTVDETGHVTEASLQASCGDAAMDQAALEAARQLVFSPALRGKEAIPVYMNVSVKWQEKSGG